MKYLIIFLFSLTFRTQYDISFVFNKNVIASLCDHKIEYTSGLGTVAYLPRLLKIQF